MTAAVGMRTGTVPVLTGNGRDDSLLFRIEGYFVSTWQDSFWHLWVRPHKITTASLAGVWRIQK